MAITLTESAARHIRSTIDKRGSGVALRLGVKSDGCSGYAYTFDIADEVGANDAVFEAHDAKVVVDREALPMLDGSVLDFRRQGLKATLQVANPNVAAQCGCGESFSVKAG